MPSKPKKRQTKPTTKRGPKSDAGGGPGAGPRTRSNKSLGVRVKDPIQKEFSKFRHEIYKFGLEGLDKKDRIDARYELAIKLGAKPKSWVKGHKNLAEKTAERELQAKKLKDNQDGKAGQTNQHIKTNSISST